MSSPRIPTLALCVFTSFAALGGSDTDPIIGVYSGSVIIEIVETFPGFPELEQHVVGQGTIDIEFATSNVVTIDTFAGTWKKKGSTHTADISSAATADLMLTWDDATAKETAKYKKIVLAPTVGITGKVVIKRSFHLDLIAVHDVIHGVFGAPITP